MVDIIWRGKTMSSLDYSFNEILINEVCPLGPYNLMLLSHYQTCCLCNNLIISKRTRIEFKYIHIQQHIKSIEQWKKCTIWCINDTFETSNLLDKVVFIYLIVHNIPFTQHSSIQWNKQSQCQIIYYSELWTIK